LERALSRQLMTSGAKFERTRLTAEECLTKQGESASDLYLLLDGILGVEVDGQTIGEMGPGTICGERALLEGGPRTATLRATCPCHVVVIPHDLLANSDLERLASGRNRENER
jgi:CRP-like cAMP-binding protein